MFSSSLPSKVCGYEKASYDESGIKALTFIAAGDMRIAINGLQSCIKGFGHCSKDTVRKMENWINLG
jgi:DNA polymerase III delta prime subunit